jgi:hypothetical protein
MAKQKEIPCASCQSWVKKQKKFSCNPDDCKGLADWLFANAPHLNDEYAQIRLKEIANQYVV